jgi:hypothetical protein
MEVSSMHKSILLFILLLVTVSGAFAAIELADFHVYPVVDHSQLMWSSGIEDNFQMFVVERSADGRAYFAVGQVSAKGSYSQYDFSDTSPLDADMQRVFYYRLKMVDRDGTYRYSEVREVSLSFSAVQRTWGSIKAMFR